jgi:hypothetical protein
LRCILDGFVVEYGEAMNIQKRLATKVTRLLLHTNVKLVHLIKNEKKLTTSLLSQKTKPVFIIKTCFHHENTYPKETSTKYIAKSKVV